MAKLFFFIAVRHPLARAASLTPPQIPLVDKTPGNTKPCGNKAPRTTTTTMPNIQECGRNNKEELLLGDKTQGYKRSASLGGKKPGENNNNNAQYPRVRLKQQRRASLGGQNPGDKRRTSLGGQNPRDNNNDNAHSSRVRSNNNNKNNSNKLHGHSKDHGHINDYGHSKDHGNQGSWT